MDVQPKSHHKRQDLCTTRPPYRQGRDLRAVKVYTVSQESRYLLVQGVPSVGGQKELLKLFASYGDIDESSILDEYLSEEFTEVFLIKFKKIQAARIAKKKLDDYSFFGGVLHVCYAPEYENVDDVREKLQDRRKAVAYRIRKLNEEKAEREEHKSSTDDAHQTLCTPHTAESQSPHLAKAITVPDSSNFLSKEVEVNPPFVMPPLHIPPPPLNTNIPPPLPLPPQNMDPAYRQAQPFIKDYTQIQGTPLPGKDHNHMVQGNSKNQPSIKEPKFKTIQISCKKGTESLIVKDPPSTKHPPKFLPRQVVKGKPLVKRTGPKTDPCSKPKEDPVNQELRMNSTVLGDKTGPELPREDEDKRQTFKNSDTGDSSLDKSTLAIREKVKQFSAVALPVQVRKKRKRKLDES